MISADFIAALIGASAGAAGLIIAAVGQEFMADVSVCGHPHPHIGMGAAGLCLFRDHLGICV
jgi:hypothetical protein